MNALARLSVQFDACARCAPAFASEDVMAKPSTRGGSRADRVRQRRVLPESRSQRPRRQAAVVVVAVQRRNARRGTGRRGVGRAANCARGEEVMPPPVVYFEPPSQRPRGSRRLRRSRPSPARAAERRRCAERRRRRLRLPGRSICPRGRSPPLSSSTAASRSRSTRPVARCAQCVQVLLSPSEPGRGRRVAVDRQLRGAHDRNSSSSESNGRS